MYLDAAKKQEIFGKYGKSNTDTGSAEAQVALFSYRISHLTEHMKLNRKDYSTERALTMLVAKRRRLLDYLKAKDITRYRAIVKELGLRSNLLAAKKLKKPFLIMRNGFLVSPFFYRIVIFSLVIIVLI